MSAIDSIRQFYFITHIDNVPSILEKGIYSHEKIIAEKIPYTPIYDNEIIVRRSGKISPDGKDLWSYANLFFEPRNPMLYRVIIEKDVKNLAVIAINKNVLQIEGVLITTGNAASDATEIRHVNELNKTYREIKQDLIREYWKEFDGSKRRIMAECLIPDHVPKEMINCIYVSDYDTAEKLKVTTNDEISVTPEPYMFFQPDSIYQITEKISLAEGDMFFSRYQTITISVNCVGIMGKGIASRAKYQYPDVYVAYQDYCRSKKLQLGKPVLYQREISNDYELADEPKFLKNPNNETWFLLFATKQHWRNDADIKGIEQGLKWIYENYKKEGIKSLALPALGCGLGNLKWEQVGPMMVHYLSQLDIPVRIFLPLERKIAKEYLTPDYLLKK